MRYFSLFSDFFLKFIYKYIHTALFCMYIIYHYVLVSDINGVVIFSLSITLTQTDV